MVGERERESGKEGKRDFNKILFTVSAFAMRWETEGCENREGLISYNLVVQSILFCCIKCNIK